MATARYIGPLSRGTVLIDGRAVGFGRLEPVDLDDDLAGRLDDHWVVDGATVTVEVELDHLDRDALLAIADTEGLDVNRRLRNPERLAEEITRARQGNPTTQES